MEAIDQRRSPSNTERERFVNVKRIEKSETGSCGVYILCGVYVQGVWHHE